MFILCLGSGCGRGGSPLFQTDGQWIRDSQGRVFISRGLNFTDGSKFPNLETGEFFPAWICPESFAEVASWGFNTVRLLIVWEALEPAPGEYNEEYLNRLEEVAGWASAAGIFVIIDMHQDLYARKFSGDGAPEWAVLDDGLEFLPPGEGSGGLSPDLWYLNYSTPAVQRAFDSFYENREGIQDHFIEAWRRVVERFRGNRDVVGYDLLNEPFPGSRLLELDDFDRDYLAPLYERLTETIMAADPDHLLFLEPNAFRTNVLAASGFPSGMMPFSRYPDRLVFAPHFYDPEVTSSLVYDGGITRLEENMARLAAEAERLEMPVWVGEFSVWGGNVANGGQFLNDQITVFDRYLSGFSFWNYSRNPADGTSPQNTTWMLDILARPQPAWIAGIPLAWNYDLVGAAFELKFKEEKPGLASEILVPGRFCRPGDCRVEIEPVRSNSWEAGRSPGVNILKIWSNSLETEVAVRISAM